MPIAICKIHGAWDTEKYTPAYEDGAECPSCVVACTKAMNPGPTPYERIATALERIADALERPFKPDSPEIR
jgi:hypothetical protein